MRKWDPLNARQLEVLRRIASNEDLNGDAAAKTSATSLRHRGLIAVTRRTGEWTAEVTDAGRFYLDHGRHPDHPDVANSKRGTRHTRPAPGVSKRLPPHATARVTSERRKAAVDLVAKLIEQKRVMITQPTEDEIAEWRKVVDFAKRHTLVPAGFRIEKTRMFGGDLRINLCEGAHPNAKPVMDESHRVEVPEQIEQLHPLLAHLQNPADVLGVSAQLLPRALRIMHTVLTEAEVRGHDTGWAEETTAGVEIRACGLRFQVTLGEEHVKRDVLPRQDELASRKVYAWQRFQPETKFVPSGKLRLELDGGARFDRTRSWADRQRWSVEDKLGEVIAEIEARIQAESARLLAEEQAKQQRQRDWEAAMTRARARFQEDRRIATLTTQLTNWETAAKIRDYCSALDEAALTGDDPDEVEAQSRWREWCRSYADLIDPVKSGSSAPSEVEPQPSDLQPYLGRWSPYGP